MEKDKEGGREKGVYLNRMREKKSLPQSCLLTTIATISI